VEEGMKEQMVGSDRMDMRRAVTAVKPYNNV
jgi:hypothetical protein